eukprot:scaffold17864_cov36-Phaeocystis_antarctica.AAC.2
MRPPEEARMISGFAAARRMPIHINLPYAVGGGVEDRVLRVRPAAPWRLGWTPRYSIQRLYGWLRQPPDCPTEAPSSPIDTGSPRCSRSKNRRRPAALPSSTTDRPRASASARRSIGTSHQSARGRSATGGKCRSGAQRASGFC